MIQDPSLILFSYDYQKHGKKRSSVIVTVTDTAFAPHLRYKKEYITVTTISPKTPNAKVMNTVLLPLAADVLLGKLGYWKFKDDLGNTINPRTIELALGTADARGIPDLNNQTQTPAINGACYNCKTQGQTTADRTIYKPFDSRAEQWTQTDWIQLGLRTRHRELSRGEKPIFHDINPLVAQLGLRPSRLAYCPPHNDVAVIKDFVTLVANQGSRSYTPKARESDYALHPHLRPIPMMQADGTPLRRRNKEGKNVQVYDNRRYYRGDHMFN